MDLPSRIPVLRDNPVFVLEARRMWRGRAAPFAAVGLVVLGIVIGLHGWSHAAALAWAIALLMVPGAVGGLISHEREQERLQAILVTGIKASRVLSGKLGVVMVPLGLMFLPMVLATFFVGTGDLTRLDAMSVQLAGMCSLVSAGILALAVSACVRRTVYAIPLAYVAVWAVMATAQIATEYLAPGSGTYGEGLPAVSVVVWQAIFSVLAWVVGVEAVRRSAA